MRIYKVCQGKNVLQHTFPSVCSGNHHSGAPLSRNADILKSLRVIKKLPEQILQIHSVIYALCLSSAEWQLQNCTILMRKNRKIYVPEFGCGPTVGLRSHYAAPRGLVCLFIDPNPLWQIHRKPMMHKGLC